MKDVLFMQSKFLNNIMKIIIFVIYALVYYVISNIESKYLELNKFGNIVLFIILISPLLYIYNNKKS